ncbi:cation/H(+) antiporter 4-like [Euphorbia lathyris]|uniref:cation/H(+) antiporter 4-like n=1 Tax=Euphorbia lathyris TaxID=212925 RepID=UPI00331359DE
MLSTASVAVVATVKICYNLTESVNSHGILNSMANPDSHYLSYPLPLLELQMVLILTVSHAFRFLLSRVGLSSTFTCSILTGILLGPTFLGQHEFMQVYVFPRSSQLTVQVLSLMGIQMFFFLTAVKMEIEVLRKVGRKEISLGISSVAVPFLIGVAYKSFVNPDYETGEDKIVIKEQSLTHFPVIAFLVSQLKISNSEIGRLVLSSALVADIFSFSSTITACLADKRTKGCNVRDISGIVLVVAFAAFAVRPALVWMIRKTPRGKPVNAFTSCIISALFVSLGFYYLYFPQVAAVSPFIFGFAVPSGPPIGSALVNKFEALTLGVLLPIHIATAVMRADFDQIVPGLGENLWYFISILIFLFAVKWIACVIPPLLYKMPLKQCFAVAFIMSCKGLIELASYAMLKDAQLVSVPVYSLLVLSILFSSTISRVLAKHLYRPSRKYEGFQSRNMESSKPETKLGILACIHEPEDTASIFRVIDTIHPTKENPIGIYVLHLIELLGRSTPVFISHEKNKSASQYEYSQNVLVHFDQYEQNNLDVISVDAFTAISPASLMDEDVCSVALDNNASLILIPLHRMWSSAKTFDPACTSLKNLTVKVFQKAPCSVGIFLDRSRLGIQPMQATKGPFRSMCLIFLSGNDDREALCIAMRMTRSCSETRLTVLHIVHDEEDIDWTESAEKVLDDRALKKLSKTSASNARIEYRREVVKDGAGTALVVHSMANDFDLFVVGRRYGVECPQTMGLSDWGQFPEIGDIGDLLASKDLKTGASVLVVQQQIKDGPDIVD